MKTKVESFDDIVFENRNQEYGAYELRKKYPRRGTVALSISLNCFYGISNDMYHMSNNRNYE